MSLYTLDPWDYLNLGGGDLGSWVSWNYKNFGIKFKYQSHAIKAYNYAVKMGNNIYNALKFIWWSQVFGVSSYYRYKLKYGMIRTDYSSASVYTPYIVSKMAGTDGYINPYG